MSEGNSDQYEFSFLPVKMSLKPGSKRTVLFKVKNKVGPELKIDGLKALITNVDGNQLKDISIPVSFVSE